MILTFCDVKAYHQAIESVRKTCWSTVCLTFLVVITVSCDRHRTDEALPYRSSMAHVDQSFFSEPVNVGAFSINWFGKDEQSVQLHIEHQALNSAWQTAAGQSFISAAFAHFEAEEYAGSFKIEEHVQVKCHSQTLESWKHQARTLFIYGELSCDGEAVSYELSLVALSNSRLDIKLDIQDERVGRSGLFFLSDAGEQVFGLGEQFSAFNF